MLTHVRISEQALDPAGEAARLPSDAGAIVSFTGCVRADDGVSALSLEHYPGMTEREIAGHVAEAGRRWPLVGAVVVHRVGRLKPGEPIVLVAVAATHRREAFAACEFLIDYLKTKAPFWKQEHRGAGARWVEARASDAAAAQRWSK